MAAPLTPTSPTTQAAILPLKPKRSVSTNELAPVITITPPSLVLPLTPPLTPGTSPTAPRPITSNGSFVTPPINPAFVPLPSPTPTPPSPSLFELPQGGSGSLEEPLRRHLALLHPNTPPTVRNFVAIRLLSPDRPFGHAGDWTPIAQGSDLLKAGVGSDAAKGCVQVGEGRRRDEELEAMYAIARESYRRLQMRAEQLH